MYHFSGPSASIKPPDELELSEPLLCLPLFIGVDVPGGDNDMFAVVRGVLIPGDLDSGEAWR